MDTTVPAAVVIGQDSQTEIHVQPVVQSGSRHLDIRIWRQGPSGFAPSRNALVVQPADLQPLQQGIGELLEASDGGRQAARIVWDDDDNRRLRAETEPFGTRYLARFAFWQRVRDSWKAADDGLVLAADRLVPLQEVLEQFKPWMDERPVEDTEPEEDALQRHALYGWPSPGGDWLTIDPDHIAFHPRGIRITCTVAEEEDRRAIVLRQWRRMDSLWVPEDDTVIALTVVDLDTLLFEMARLLERRSGPGTSVEIPCSDGSTLRMTVSAGEHEDMLTLQQRPPDDGADDRRGLSLPYQYLPRLGRMLLLAGSFLAARLSEEERNVLQSGDHASPSVVAYDSMPEPIRYEVADSSLSNDKNVGDESGAAAEADLDGTADSGASSDGEGPDGIGPFDGEGNPLNEEPAIQSVALQEMELGQHLVFLTLQLGNQNNLMVHWEGGMLALPMEELEELVADLRELYYAALRGRRGQPLTVGGSAPVTISVHNRGTEMYCTLEHESYGSTKRLQFPANQVPLFLDAAQSALAKMEREILA